MSKKLTSKQSNTIFNYFQSPKSNSAASKTSASNLEVNNDKSQKMDTDEGSDDEPIQTQTKKRSRIIDSDSDSENCEPATTSSNLKKFCKKIKKESSEEDLNGKDESVPKPTKSNETEKSSLKDESANDGLWLHEKLDFLKPDNIRDIKKRKKDDPDYDPHTLHVPESYLNTLTPAMRQWWILKSEHFDSVLFFKVGKFYELYHMDAVTGVNHLGFTFMRGEFAHSGFPEIAFGRMASSLIEQGFKVARVEQTETPEMMAERCKNKKVTKYDKVVNREICQVTMKGTCMYGPQMNNAKSALACYMLAIAEKPQNDQSVRYGVCFIDTSIGTFHMAEFLDDRHCSKLLVLLSEHPPALVLVERSKTSSTTHDILKKNVDNARIEKLVSPQFYNADVTLQKLQEGCYFKDEEDNFSWPHGLSDLIDDDRCKPGYELTVSALGACLWYLKDSFLDIQVLTMKKFEMYIPFAHGESSLNKEYMILDAATIENLNLLGKTGTMQKTLDLCCTSFGKRLLQQWICRPLCNIEKITGRQDAVKELFNNNEYLRSARDLLKKLPDLERQVMKINTFGNKHFAERHPDSRAIFYEANTYFKRKILDLTGTLKGFATATEIVSIFKDCQSRLLRKITHCSPDGLFSDITETLNYFKSAFDQTEAEKQGKIIPQAGIDPKYDEAEAAIAEINNELNEYLETQKAFFKCNVVYFGSEKKRYQLEIPDNKCHKVTSVYSIESSRKGSKPVKRYSTPETKEFLARMMKAEQNRATIVEDLNRRIFEKFSENFEDWEQITNCLAMLDVLCSLAEYARTYSQAICLPTILPFSKTPVIKIENGRHPCIPKVDDYVPNDTELGTENKPGILILTGPNMGGKSTLMRQVALIIIMAQIGGYVPASNCELSLVDRIFTRLGAQDDIMSGQSTFFVEVSEASAILQHATRHSFVLLDELGRGTSTHDGNAIATAYMKKLLEINCRVIYSTHYHTLVEYYGIKPDIQLGHMACIIEHEGESTKETVTFLYKLEPGACSNSYGFNVAKLAGLPRSIVERARDIAIQLERNNKNRQILTELLATKDIVSLRGIVASLKTIDI